MYHVSPIHKPCHTNLEPKFLTLTHSPASRFLANGNSVIETDPPDTTSYKGGIPPGGVKIRCSLDLADEFTCAWPALLLRHGDERRGEAEGDEEGGGGEGTGVEKWRVSAGFGGLVLSKVASGEGAAADSSPFIRLVCSLLCRVLAAVKRKVHYYVLCVCRRVP